MIADKSAFFDHNQIITIPMEKGDKKFVIALNMPVKTYLKMLCGYDDMANANDNAKFNAMVNMSTMLLQLADKRITAEWVLKYLTPQDQLDLISTLMASLDKLIDAECFKIPDIEFEKKQKTAKNDMAKERQKTKEDIMRLNSILKDKKDRYLMDEVAIVMTKTHNNFNDIMTMPILVFIDIVRTLTINELRSDDDYNLAYLKYEYNRIKDKLNSDEAIETPRKNNGADVKGLKALLG